MSWLVVLKVALFSAIVVAGVGPVHYVVHFLQVHKEEVVNHNGCSCHHDQQEKQGRPEKDNHKDCPECQAIHSLKTVDPPPIQSDYLIAYERFDATTTLADIVVEKPVFLLPNIRAPPAFRVNPFRV